MSDRGSIHACRRTFVAGCLAALAPCAPAHAMVGLFAPREILAILSGLSAIEQGTGTPTLHVLVSPGCDHSAAMWETVQGRLSEARYRWIPFSGNRDADAVTVASLLDVGTPEAVRTALTGRRPDGAPSPVARRIAEQQDALVQSRVARLAWESTTRPLAAPSLVYDTSDGPVLVRGSITSAMLDEVLSSAR